MLLWPVAELETLRDVNVQLSNVELNQGDKVEVEGITAAQVRNSILATYIQYRQSTLNRNITCSRGSAGPTWTLDLPLIMIMIINTGGCGCGFYVPKFG